VTLMPDPRDLPSLYDQLKETLTDMAERPHYRIRNGKILHDRKTGQPLTAKGPADEARRLLAALKRNRTLLGNGPDSTPRPAEGPETS